VNGTPAFCFHKKLSCRSFLGFATTGIEVRPAGKGLKYCSASSLPSSPNPPPKLNSLPEAQKEIFFKTLAFYCTLTEKGCAFELGTDGDDIGPTGLADINPDSENSDSESECEARTKIIKDCRRRPSSRSLCKGKLELRLYEYGGSFVQ
jgi:hypothetical protein